jgi:cytochrome oxidase Cu insertion factor (SCO1/SenC/PrrC family)
MPAVNRLIVLMTLALLAAGCSRLSPRIAKAKSGPPTIGVDEGQIAPEIEGDDIDGKHFKLSDYRGKVVLLDFWATW